MDYSLILPTPVKEGGVRMAGRWKEKSISGLTIGPGYYECGYTAHHTQGVVFGSEERDHTFRERGFSYVDKFTPNEVHKTIAYSFTKDKRDLSLNIEKTVAIPGPGHYTISDNVIRPKASSLLIIPDLKGSFTKNSDQTNLSFIDPKPSLKTNSNFQKFSKVSRFLNENFRYRSLLLRKNSSPQAILNKNIKLINTNTKRNRYKKLRINKKKLESKIVSVQIAKESKCIPY